MELSSQPIQEDAPLYQPPAHITVKGVRETRVYSEGFVDGFKAYSNIANLQSFSFLTGIFIGAVMIVMLRRIVKGRYGCDGR
jgi:hypothetical protein